jgi:hypothetical protein
MKRLKTEEENEHESLPASASEDTPTQETRLSEKLPVSEIQSAQEKASPAQNTIDELAVSAGPEVLEIGPEADVRARLSQEKECKGSIDGDHEEDDDEVDYAMPGIVDCEPDEDDDGEE